MAEPNVEQLMALLDLTEDEAKQLIADDKRVDKGEKVEWDLTDEQKKNAKKATMTGTRKTNGKATRTRAENPMKRAIIETLFEALNGYEDVKVENVERLISFSADGNDYTITLTQKRKKS